MFESNNNNEGHHFSFDQILYVHICESLGFWRYLRDTHGAQKLLVWQADSLEFGPFNNSWLKSVAHWLGAGLSLLRCHLSILVDLGPFTTRFCDQETVCAWCCNGSAVLAC